MPFPNQSILTYHLPCVLTWKTTILSQSSKGSWLLVISFIFFPFHYSLFTFIIHVCLILLTQCIVALVVTFAQTIATSTAQLNVNPLKVSSCYSKNLKDTIKASLWIPIYFSCVFDCGTAGALVLYPLHQIYFFLFRLSFKFISFEMFFVTFLF